MKHLTKQEAIGRMMLAQAGLIEINVSCNLNWYHSTGVLMLTCYPSYGAELPQLSILGHPDFESFKEDFTGANFCMKYIWHSKTEAQ